MRIISGFIYMLLVDVLDRILGVHILYRFVSFLIITVWMYRIVVYNNNNINKKYNNRNNRNRISRQNKQKQNKIVKIITNNNNNNKYHKYHNNQVTPKITYNKVITIITKSKHIQ